MQEAAEVCLEAAGDKPSANAATILAQLLTTAGKETVSLEQVQPLIRAALETEGDNVQLLMAVAVMHVSRGDSKEAIGLLRRVVELAPKQTMALNNLATMLAEQPDGHAEALEMIERAIAIAGRQAGPARHAGDDLPASGRSGQSGRWPRRGSGRRPVRPALLLPSGGGLPGLRKNRERRGCPRKSPKPMVWTPPS